MQFCGSRQKSGKRKREEESLMNWQDMYDMIFKNHTEIFATIIARLMKEKIHYLLRIIIYSDNYLDD